MCLSLPWEQQTPCDGATPWKRVDTQTRQWLTFNRSSDTVRCSLECAQPVIKDGPNGGRKKKKHPSSSASPVSPSSVYPPPPTISSSGANRSNWKQLKVNRFSEPPGWQVWLNRFWGERLILVWLLGMAHCYCLCSAAPTNMELKHNVRLQRTHDTHDFLIYTF